MNAPGRRVHGRDALNPVAIYCPIHSTDFLGLNPATAFGLDLSHDPTSELFFHE